MEFVRIALRGDAEYHRINCAKVKSATFSDEDEAYYSPSPAKADQAPLLKAMAGDFHDSAHYEPDVEIGVTCINPRRLKHVKSAFTRKHKSHKGNATIQLRIRKMDNTSFALAVPKNATVMELKRILQNKFDSSSGCNISWPHVWGNFCLSFNNQKLLDNGKHLHQLGISDSNELYFVRHMTNSSGQSEYCQRQCFFINMSRKRDALMQRNG